MLKVYSMHYTLKKPQMLKKISLGQNKRHKKCANIFLTRDPTDHSFNFKSQFLYELKHKVPLSKTLSGVFHFRFCLIFIKVHIFVQQNARTL